jgi:hypothetical protein
MVNESLINPNQIRSYSIPFWDNPFDPSHGLTIKVNDSLHSAPMCQVSGTQATLWLMIQATDQGLKYSSVEAPIGFWLIHIPNNTNM